VVTHGAGDPERIHQVVMNLVENAVRYSPRPGEIALRASAGADHTVTIEVDDEGLGISEDCLGRVLERFYRGDGRRTRSPDGSRGSGDAGGGGGGLGLVIARWIVELHGGAIRAQRREPHASHMVLTLPAGRT